MTSQNKHTYLGGKYNTGQLRKKSKDQPEIKGKSKDNQLSRANL